MENQLHCGSVFEPAHKTDCLRGGKADGAGLVQHVRLLITEDFCEFDREKGAGIPGTNLRTLLLQLDEGSAPPSSAHGQPLSLCQRITEHGHQEFISSDGQEPSNFLADLVDPTGRILDHAPHPKLAGDPRRNHRRGRHGGVRYWLQAAASITQVRATFL